MWDWAYKNKKDWKSKMLDEEEDDDQSRPTEVGEEENEDSHRSRSRSGASPLPDRRAKRKGSSTVPADDEDNEEEPARGSDIDDESASVDALSIPMPPDDTVNDPDYVFEDDERLAATAANAHETRGRSATHGASPEASDDENADDDDVEAVEGEPPEDEEDGLDGNPPGDSEDEAEDGGEDTPAVPAPSTIASSLVPPTAAAAVNAANDPDSTMTLMDIDTAPIPEQVLPIQAAAAASSIMANSALLSPPAPSPSNSSAGSPNHSPTSSRSPTPDPPSDREIEPKRGTAKTRGAKAKGGRTTRNKSKRKTKAEIALEQDAEQESHLADGEDRDADIEDVDADSPEIDVELELQPAHRAEALDVLATIELKFALLRESVYVDKMENLAWEEALVTEGVYSRAYSKVKNSIHGCIL